MNLEGIDGGKPFDWGRTSEDYAKYRDIYPEMFYRKIVDRGLCVAGQTVLDLGTGTGVLPRNLYPYGAKWIGVDASKEQIVQARRLAREQGMKIDFIASAAEELNIPDEIFDVVTACQCFWYFDAARLTPLLSHILKRDGRLLILQMNWLPLEDEIAGASEELVLKYSPSWSGAGYTRNPVPLPDALFDSFELVGHEEYDVKVSFTRESWHGRMKACRGVGASLSEEELARWEQEHQALLERIAPESFEILHYVGLAELRVKKDMVCKRKLWDKSSSLWRQPATASGSRGGIGIS